MSVIKQAEPKAKSREAGNNQVRLEAARRTIEELEGAGRTEPAN
jgi:hypothetical protein